MISFNIYLFLKYFLHLKTLLDAELEELCRNSDFECPKLHCKNSTYIVWCDFLSCITFFLQIEAMSGYFDPISVFTWFYLWIWFCLHTHYSHYIVKVIFHFEYYDPCFQIVNLSLEASACIDDALMYRNLCREGLIWKTLIHRARIIFLIFST